MILWMGTEECGTFSWKPTIKQVPLAARHIMLKYGIIGQRPLPIIF